jgi:hypothetical protein
MSGSTSGGPLSRHAGAAESCGTTQGADSGACAAASQGATPQGATAPQGTQAQECGAAPSRSLKIVSYARPRFVPPPAVTRARRIAPTVHGQHAFSDGIRLRRRQRARFAPHTADVLHHPTSPCHVACNARHDAWRKSYNAARALVSKTSWHRPLLDKRWDLLNIEEGRTLLIGARRAARRIRPSRSSLC